MIIYKYLHSDRVDFFSSFKLRFTPPKDLNDPRECIPEIRIKDLKEYIASVVKRNFDYLHNKLSNENPDLNNRQILEKMNEVINKFNESDFNSEEENNKRILKHFNNVTNRFLGILSLTETNDNELMWAHYADSHKGFVVGFDSESEFFKPKKEDPNLCGELVKIKYDEFAPTVYVVPYKLDIPKELFFTKTKKWNYEYEWRILKLLSSADEIVDDKFHLFELPFDSIKEVIFGMKTPENIRKGIRDKLILKAPNILFREAILNNKSEFFIK